MIVVSGWKIVGPPAWNFKFKVKLFYIVFFPQYYNALMLNTLSSLTIAFTKIIHVPLSQALLSLFIYKIKKVNFK